jgi:phosphoglycolate phosphatase
MKWTVDTIVFDFDGVLVNTGVDIANAANYMLAYLGKQEQPVEKIISFIGGGAEPLVRKCLGAQAETLYDQGLDIFKKRYAEFYFVETKPYPGTRQILDHYRARQKNMGIATNKVQRLTQGILNGLDMQHYFPVIIGPESITHRKPHPEAVMKVLEYFSAPPERALMIGDTAEDLQAGKSAGALTCGVTYGFGSLESIQSAEPDIILDEISQLIEYIE